MDVLVGVDMGSAISRFFFCLAIDPLIRILNKIPKIVETRCYMDDNAVACLGIKPIRIAQDSFMTFRAVGIRVKTHTCCAFLPVARTVNPAVSRTCAAGPCWYLAAQNALTRWPQAKLFRPLNGTFFLARKTLIAIAFKATKGRRALIRLCELRCSCGCKTAYISRRQVSAAQLQALDALPWGAKPITSSSKALGLPLHSRHSSPIFSKAKLASKFSRAAIAKAAHANSLNKCADRAARVHETMSPMHQQLVCCFIYAKHHLLPFLCVPPHVGYLHHKTGTVTTYPLCSPMGQKRTHPSFLQGDRSGRRPVYLCICSLIQTWPAPSTTWTASTRHCHGHYYMPWPSSFPAR